MLLIGEPVVCFVFSSYASYDFDLDDASLTTYLFLVAKYDVQN